MESNNDQELLTQVFIDTGEFACNLATPCDYKERTISYAIGVQIPVPALDPDIIFKECCYQHYVLADASSTLDFKNDYSGFHHQRQLSNETCDFFLYKYENGLEYPLVNATYGQYFGFGAFPTNIGLKGYKVEWKKVLATLGEGSYRIIKRVVVAGVSVDTNSICFTLRQYSSYLADRTMRMDIVMNGRIEREGTNFVGVGWRHSMRIGGFFGRREPKFEEDNLIDRNFRKEQISMLQKNEYLFQTNFVPSCITDEILDFMLFANDIYMNDYNLNNHSYTYVNFGVKVANNNGTDYGNVTRKARLNLVFSDKKEDRVKRNFT